jgi:UDP-N-acetyl-D-galactosamine dehydrogenase
MKNKKTDYLNDIKLAIIGLGYVGLPLAVEFGKTRNVIGYDIDVTRIENLKKGIDSTLEISKDELQESGGLTFSCNSEAIEDSNFYIVTVPTPIDNYKKPDLTPLFKASEIIGDVLKVGDTVVYESTVYPGCIEEDCVPVLEKFSGLKFNKDFFVGYSPERINPGDKEHRISNIKKITSGSNNEISEKIDSLYRSIIVAGTYKAKSIKVAEAAKVIENTQRDVNIALVNELSMIFNKLNIDTHEVLEAAGTKWNFLPFQPGLVGGHCIGVDPYYLTHKAQSVGYHPEIVLAGRRINDSMGEYVAKQVILEMSRNGSVVLNSKILVLGLTFKEDCPDLRNSKVVDVINELTSHGANVDVHDPWVDKKIAKEYFNIELIDKIQKKYTAIIFAVAHKHFKTEAKNIIKKFSEKNAVIYDLKKIVPKDISTISL